MRSVLSLAVADWDGGGRVIWDESEGQRTRLGRKRRRVCSGATL